MTHRHRTWVVLLTSAAAATLGLTRLIHGQQEHPSGENHSHDLALQSVERRLNLTDELLKNKDNAYITIESTDEVITARYRQALQYIKQAHSTNTHIRERGLSHLAKLEHLPPTYYTLIGQQLDLHSAIQLARTREADSNLFPSGPPYIFSTSNKKILATDNVENVNDDDVLLHTIREFLDKLIDKDKRPLDILSHHYLTLVRTIVPTNHPFEPLLSSADCKTDRRMCEALDFGALVC